MLMRFLQSLRANRERTRHTLPGTDSSGRPSGAESPLLRALRLKRAHAAAPTAAHLDILYGQLRIADQSLLTVLEACIRSDTVSPHKVLHRPLASYFLAQYFLRSLEIEGERAECGVFQGASALLLCHTARTLDASFAGGGLHLIDSFEGLSEPIDEDSFEVRDADAAAAKSITGAGSFAAPLEIVRRMLREFPQVAFHKGWIPLVFERLPETAWAFVHLDVDLYQPTYAGLHYFYPRLAAGGVIICDDYGAPLFPGAHRAWDRYCDEHDIPYVVLDTGQSVILKT